EQIEGEAAARELLQKSRDFRVLSGPVSLERNNAACRKGLTHRLAIEGDAFVDQAGDAPGGRQIDKDGLPGRLESRQPLRGERLVGEFPLWGGAGYSLARR